MIRPCERSVRCFPCADDNPFANLSAEDPDLNVYLSVVFVPGTNPPHNNWNAWYCTGFCESAISQVDADDCARRKALECIINTLPPPKPDNPSWPTSRACNDERTCEKDGQCYTIPACTVIQFTALEANSIAQSLCNYRVYDPALTTPCGSTVPTPPMPPTQMGPMVTYEKAWNEPARGEWTESDPCPWPDDYASTWVGGISQLICLCNGDNQDPYQWPFGAGTPTDTDSIVTQSENNLDAVLDSNVLPDTPDYENVSSIERLYLRTRIEGGPSGKHVLLEAHWSKPGGAWTERYWNGDLFQFEDFPASSSFLLKIKYDPCSCFQNVNFLGSEPQVDAISNTSESGDVTYEFDIPAGGIYYACIRVESKTHSNGPSTLHVVTTITNL